MKKRLSILILLIMLCSSSILSGCFMKLEPYIKVYGIKTEYKVGDSLIVEGVKIHYFEDSDSRDYTVIDLEESMVSNFSTVEVGTFYMTITYNKLTVVVEYIVESSNGGQNPSSSVNLTESQTETLMTQVENTMCSYAQIKEETRIEMFGMTSSTLRITTQTKRYEYEDEENIAWIIKNGNNWQRYEIEYDWWEECMTYTKYNIQTQSNDVRVYTYSNMFDEDDYKFEKATKTNNQYLIEYSSLDMVGFKYEVRVKNNVIEKIEYYDVSEGSKVYCGAMTFSYFVSQTNTIPSIPNHNWDDGGIYVEM